LKVLLIVLDVRRVDHLQSIKNELYKCGLRLNENPPRVRIKKKTRGGIHITSTCEQDVLNEGIIKGVMNAYNYHNAEIVLYEKMDENRFIDAIRANRVYVPAVIAVNKIDCVPKDYEIELDEGYVKISAKENIGLEKVREKIYEGLDRIRIFLKPQGEDADLEEPMILDNGSTILDLCRRLHKDFEKKFRYALVWGENVKHQGQRVGIHHKLSDGEIVSIIKER
jgi:ribosome-interacting GTPase 1